MATDSTQAGFLAPTTTALYDIALEDFFQGVIAGITGLPGNLVRPRWQPNPANQPPPTTEWIAFGVSLGSEQWNAYQRFDPNIPPEGAYIVEAVEDIKVKVSFYGVNNLALQRRFVAGLQIEQNRAELQAQKIEYKHCDAPVNLPVLLKEAWYLRSDSLFTFQRWVTRTYPIKTLLSADGSVSSGDITTTLSAQP